MNKKDNLLRKIENINSQIALLNNLKKKLANQIGNLPQENTISINSHTPPDFNRKQVLSDISTVDKINLFRSLFHGRDDVYARFWISKKTGKSGYSPVCKNEWVNRICQKPIMKCSGCPNRELIPPIFWRYL